MADKKTITTIRLSESLLKALGRRAAAEGRSRSNLIELVLKQSVSERKSKGKESEDVLA